MQASAGSWMELSLLWMLNRPVSARTIPLLGSPAADRGVFLRK